MAIAPPPFADSYPVHDTHGQLIATAYYHPSTELLRVVWTGNLTTAEVMRVADIFLQLQATLPITRLYNDKTDTTGDWSEALAWLEFEWLPQAIRNGLRAVAYVLSPDVSNQLISRRFTERISPYLPTEMFYNYDNDRALTWLQAQ